MANYVFYQREKVTGMPLAAAKCAVEKHGAKVLRAEEEISMLVDAEPDVVEHLARALPGWVNAVETYYRRPERVGLFWNITNKKQ